MPEEYQDMINYSGFTYPEAIKFANDNFETQSSDTKSVKED